MVVTDLWIYWVVSVPLTLIVLLSWRFWWHYQKIYYMRRYPHAMEEKVSLASNVTTLPVWIDVLCYWRTKSDGK